MRGLLKRSVRFRLLTRWLRSRTYAYPRWAPIVARHRALWDEALAKAKHGPKMLIATGVGGHPTAVTLESLLGVALTLRGAEVHFLLCDSLLPACDLAEATWFPDHRTFVRAGPQSRLCSVCFAPSVAAYAALGLPVHRYSEFLGPDDRRRVEELSATQALRDIPSYRADGVAVGEHARAGALRFFASGDLVREPHGEGVLRRYFRAALLTATVAARVFARSDYTTAVFQHGIYVPQGLVGEVARRRAVRVVNWNVAYRKRRFVFSHHDTYHHTLMTEPIGHWEGLELNPSLEADLLRYLESRRDGSRDWIWFHERPVEDLGAIARELGIDFSRPCIGMLTNVMWDAQLHYPANAFPSMLDWAVETIKYFEKRPDLQLIIRVHPAEIRGTLPSRQPLIPELRKSLPELPKNVFVIPPESRISTYATMSQCNAVIIFGTKTGVELASRGIPVIVAGEAWIRGKGISLDASSAADYFRILDTLPLPGRMTDEVVKRARRYAYHFFFRRMVPLDLVQPLTGWLPYRLDVPSLDACMPGASEGLDVVCDGILHGSEFIYPEERRSPRPV